MRTTDTGITYGYSKVLISNSTNPTFLIGRNSKEDQTYKADWVSSGDGFFVSGVKLEKSDSPTLYFSENNKVKKVTISRSGIWLPLFNESDPTTDELEAILNEAIKQQNKKG